MVGSKGRLLFIDESSRSSSPARRREINAHVQKTRYERTRIGKIDALRAHHSPASPSLVLPSQSDFPTSRETFSSNIPGPVYLEPKEGVEDSENNTGRTTWGKDWQERFKQKHATPTRHSLSSGGSSRLEWTSACHDQSDQQKELVDKVHDIGDPPGRKNPAGEMKMAFQPKSLGSAGDPFHTTVVKLDAWTASMLEYYLHLMTSGVFRAETAFLAPGEQFRHATLLRKAMSRSLSNKMHFCALMAGSSGRLKLNNNQHKLRAEPEAFAERALKALRIYLHQEHDYATTDPQVVLDIHALMLLATYERDYSAARVHLSMIIYTVDKRYGFQSLENIYQELCVQGDIGLSRAAFTRPITPDSWYPKGLPHRLSEELKPSLSPQALPAGQGFSSHSHILGNTLLFIAYDTADFARAASVAWENGGTSPQDAQWLSHTSHALLHRLLVLTPLPPTEGTGPVHSDPAEGLAHHREAIRLSLVIWLSFITTYLAPTTLGRQRPLRLQTALAQSRAVHQDSSAHNSWQGSEALLLWLHSIGHSVARITDSETRGYFATGVIEMAERLGVETVADLRSVIEGFLYNERAQGPSLWELADKLRARRSMG